MTRSRLAAALGVAATISGVAMFTGAVPTGVTALAHADQTETRDNVNNVRSGTSFGVGFVTVVLSKG